MVPRDTRAKIIAMITRMRPHAAAARGGVSIPASQRKNAYAKKATAISTATSAINASAMESASCARKRRTERLPAADEQAEHDSDSEDHHRALHRALFDFIDQPLGASLGFAPAAVSGFADAVGCFGAAVARGVFEDFADLGKSGSQNFHLRHQRLDVCFGAVVHVLPLKKPRPAECRRALLPGTILICSYRRPQTRPMALVNQVFNWLRTESPRRPALHLPDIEVLATLVKCGKALFEIVAEQRQLGEIFRRALVVFVARHLHRLVTLVRVISAASA